MADKRRDREKSKVQGDAVPCTDGGPEAGDDEQTVFGPEVPRNRAKPAASTPAPPLPERGGTLGRFVILERLGMGGMAVVYAAFDPGLDRKVAIKLLRPEVGDSWGEEARERLLREAVALGKLSHPNVVTVYEVGEVNDQVFIAQEFVQGSDLKQWMGEKRRSQSEVLDVFLQAGRGLAAAHAEGITHRDFKPANVFMGADGRARIGDFGLALAEGRDGTESWRATVSGLRRRWGDWDGSLTQTGMLLGTPHYMAPEQLAGLKEGAQTDQFSFCVALYEGLYGERPFSGQFLAKLGASLEENVLAGNVRPAPKNTQVSTWLRGVLLKGLSGLPNERYPTMEALLEELGHDPEKARRERQATRRRKMLVLGSVALAVCGPIGAWYGIKYQRARRCAAAETRLVGVWDSATKERIRMAFLDTKKSFAAGTWQRVERTLDTYTAEWTHMRAEACSATWLRGTQSEDVFDLRMRCLRKRFGELGALVKVFARADAGVVQKAAQASSSLTGTAICADEEALRARYPPPKTAEAKAKVAAIREKLAEVEAFSKTGKYQEGLELARKLEEEANAVDYRPVQAEVLYWLGHLLARVGEYETAEATLLEAARTTGESGDGLLAAKAMARLVMVVGYQQARHEEGKLLGRAAEVMLGVAGGDETVRSMLLSSMGAVFLESGEYDKAREYFFKALQIGEKAPGPERPEAAKSLNNIGVVFEVQGEYDEALEYHRKALAIREKVLGPEHPHVAMSLNNMGEVFQAQGEYDKALEYLRKSLAIDEKALGPDHPDVAYALNSMGAVFLESGEYDKAPEYFSKALQIWENALGPEHPRVTWVLQELGVLFSTLGEYEEALLHLKRALTILENTFGPGHPDAAWPLCVLGNVHYKTGQFKEAQHYFERAVAMCQKKRCEPRADHGIQFGLAKVLWQTETNRAHARALGEQAREGYAKVPLRFRKELEEVNAWLKERGGGPVHGKPDFEETP